MTKEEEIKGKVCKYSKMHGFLVIHGEDCLHITIKN